LRRLSLVFSAGSVLIAGLGKRRESEPE